MSTNPNPPAPGADERLGRLEQRMDDMHDVLQAQSARIDQILSRLTPVTPQGARETPTEKTGDPLQEQIASFVSRRAMLKKAALATLGAATVFEAMPSATAAGTNGNALILGEANTATAATQVTTTSGTGFEASADGGIGVLAMSNSGSGLYAVSASGSYGALVVGTSGSGLYAQGNGSAGYGAILVGNRAPLSLIPGVLSDPNTGTAFHNSGELFVDSTNGLWYSVVQGTPGKWRKLADKSTAGSFALLSDPTRFIDTRSDSASFTPGVAAPAPGGSAVSTYIFSGANALTPFSSGGTPPSIPHGATALVGRITVLSGESGSSVGGVLKISGSTPPGFGSGIIAWKTTPATQILPFVLGINNTAVSGSGVIFCQNTSTTDTIDFVLDVTGYFY